MLREKIMTTRQDRAQPLVIPRFEGIIRFFESEARQSGANNIRRYKEAENPCAWQVILCKPQRLLHTETQLHFPPKNAMIFVIIQYSRVLPPAGRNDSVDLFLLSAKGA